MATLTPVSPNRSSNATVNGAQTGPIRPARWRQILTIVCSNTQLLIGVICVGFLVFLALAAPLIAPRAPDALDLQATLQPPGSGALLGTDELGRDVFSRLVYGGRASLFVAGTTVALSLLVGMPLGLIAGYLRGPVDSLIMRFMDALLAFPAILLAIAITAALGPGLTNAMIAIAVVSFPGFARIARGQALQLRSLEFVQAARALGYGHTRIVLRHILPNSLAPLIVAAATTGAAAILAEAALSFVGLGVTPPAPSWGGMLQNGYPLLAQAPWLSILPGAAIALAALGFNFLGDGLRDVLDPRLRGK